MAAGSSCSFVGAFACPVGIQRDAFVAAGGGGLYGAGDGTGGGGGFGNAGAAGGPGGCGNARAAVGCGKGGFAGMIPGTSTAVRGVTAGSIRRFTWSVWWFTSWATACSMPGHLHTPGPTLFSRQMAQTRELFARRVLKEPQCSQSPETLLRESLRLG